MKDFRRLYIRSKDGDSQKLFALLDKLKEVRDSHFPDMKERKSDKEGKLSFPCLIDDNQRAIIFLGIRNEKLQDFNIIPEGVSSLSMQQCNAIMEKFLDSIKDLIDPRIYEITLTPSQRDLARELPEDAYKRLISWEESCNKSDGGIAHGFDRERWFDFLIAVFRYQIQTGSEVPVLSSEDLGKWLREDREGELLSNYVDQLESEYVYGLELLKRYIETQD